MNDVVNAPAPARAASQELPVPTFPWPESIEYILARYERQLINHALQNADGVKRRAAQLLGISRYALERRLTRVASLLDGTATAPPKNKAAAGGAPAN
jgi:DNA-binding NtrC family response regulator